MAIIGATRRRRVKRETVCVITEVLVTTSWTFVVENSYRLIQDVMTNSWAESEYKQDVQRLSQMLKRGWRAALP